MAAADLEVLFLWHLHQPYYGRPDEETFFLPWTRLHAVKAYYDMARHLEQMPGTRGTFNFSGSLLKQLVEYTEGRGDLWGEWSETPVEELDAGTRRELIHHFFSVSYERGIKPLPRYEELFHRRQELGLDEAVKSFTDADLQDLQVLFNLAWCGHFARKDFPVVADLLRKGSGFTREDGSALLKVHRSILARVLPLYGDLLRRGQIEITVSPMYHPIIPLVIDTDEAKVATPDRPRPPRYQAREEAARQIAEALDLAEAVFGARPTGVWPSEGSVSPEAYRLFGDAGVQWIATDEEVLRRSLVGPFDRDRHLWRPWTLGDADTPRIYFRDRWLSDQLGFVYSSNPAEAAARDLVGHLSGISRALGGEPGAVSIILDGENPWEHYEDSGFPYLNALYRGLEETPRLRTSTFADATPAPGTLTNLHSGSWIHANFQIWIGHQETNAAWDWVRRAHDRIRAAREAGDIPTTALRRARHFLHLAQGSDWFWWYGDDFSSDQDAEFDALFRSFIAAIWKATGEAPPAELDSPIFAHVTPEDEEAHIKAPRGLIFPEEGDAGWFHAGEILMAGGHGAMFETFRPLDSIAFGFSKHAFCLRLSPGPDAGPGIRFEVDLFNPQEKQELRTVREFDGGPMKILFALDRLQATRQSPLSFLVKIFRGDLLVKQFPHHRFKINAPR